MNFLIIVALKPRKNPGKQGPTFKDKFHSTPVQIYEPSFLSHRLPKSIRKEEKSWKLQYRMHKCTELVVLTYNHKTSLILVGRHFNPRCTGKPQNLSLISEYFMMNGTGI